jgi:RHS repeat-associated protein
MGFRTVRTAVVAVVMSVLTAVAPTISSSASAPRSGDGSRTSTYQPGNDEVLYGFGNASGYHVVIAREDEGWSRRDAVVLRPRNLDAASWMGEQCLSGDGRYAAVTTLPLGAANDQALLDHGAVAYRVDLDTGSAEVVAMGVSLRYHTPGCGVGDEAVFTSSPGTDESSTTIVSVNLATGTTSTSHVTGEVVSVVPSGHGGLVGTFGSTLVSLPASGSGKPSAIAEVQGQPYELHPDISGAVDLLSIIPGAKRATAWQEQGGVLRHLGSGPMAQLTIQGGRLGHNLLVGADYLNQDEPLRAIPAAALQGAVTAVSLDGDLVLGTGRQLANAADPPALDVANRRTIRMAAGPAVSRKAFTAVLEATTAHSAGARLTSTQTPACAIPRNDPTRQVLQPGTAQVDWASQMAEQGLLKGSNARPAGFDSMELPGYSPSQDFPPISLLRPGAGPTTVPRSVIDAIMAQESNWDQASWHALPGIAGNPLISDYYGASGSLDTIDYGKADCGYGIAQVTSGMGAGDTTYTSNEQAEIAVDYEENIAAALNILESKWNQLYSDGIIANNGDPQYLENWFFAVWAYNTGIEPAGALDPSGCSPPGPSCTGPDGTWGLGWGNNPADSQYPPNREPFLEDTYADAAHPSDWPYEERIMGWMGSPLLDFSGNPRYKVPTYHGGSGWLNLPSHLAFCTMANDDCNPAISPVPMNPEPCTLSDYECWWHAPVTWVNCSTQCATSSFTISGGSEPGVSDPHPPTCSSTLPSYGHGAPIIVANESQYNPPLNLVGCGASNWQSNGSFSYSPGQDSAGDPVGLIDTHQLGAGFGGRILFTHTEDGSESSLINTGTWSPKLPSGAQYYSLMIHLPATGATTGDARYTINTAGYGGPWVALVNQNYGQDVWLPLGTVVLGPGATISLSNLSAMTPDAYDVAFDAMAFIPRGGSPGIPIGGSPGVQEDPGGSNVAWLNCPCTYHWAGDPVDTGTGYFSQTFRDLTTPGRGMVLSLTRTYDSSLADPNGPNGSASSDGPFGWGWNYSYDLYASTDQSGDVAIRQEDGSTVEFLPSGGGYVPSAPRIDATLTDSGGSYTYSRRGTQVFTFDIATGRLTAETDVAGANASPPYATTLAYDPSGHLNVITDPEGRTYTLGWTGSHITSVTDTAGRTVTYAYNSEDDLTDVYGVGTTRSPALLNNDHTQLTYYPGTHLLKTIRKPDLYGNTTTTPSPVTTMVYDSQERVVSQTNPIGGITTFTYGPTTTNPVLSSGQTLVTDPSTHQTLDSYSDGLLTSETRGYGTSDAGTWSYQYDPISLGVTAITDPNGNTQRFTYDENGNKTSSSDALGYTTLYTYNALNELTSTTDPLGVQTTYGYDEAGHIAEPGGTANSGALVWGDHTSTTVTELSPDADLFNGPIGVAPPRQAEFYFDDPAHPSDLTRSVDPRSFTTTTTYDVFGDKISVTNPLGDETRYGYDTSRGWLTSTVSPRGVAAGVAPGCVAPALGCTSYAHDAWGHVIETTDPNGHTTQAQFDADGNKTYSIDGNNHKTEYMYDAADFPTEVTRADSTTLTTSYNPDFTIANAANGLNQVTKYGYDGQDRQISSTDPLGRTTTNHLDSAGNVLTTTNPSGQKTTNTYDPDNRLKSITYSDGKTPSVSNESYDADGRRVSMTDGTGTSTFEYDAFGELTFSQNGANSTLEYSYDAAGNRVLIVYPEGPTRQVVQAFDAADRLQTITDWNNQQTQFGYDVDGDVVSVTYPNSTSVKDTYDNDDLLSQASLSNKASVLASLSYTRDMANQLHSVTPSGLPGAQPETYTYSPIEQLQQVTSTPNTAYSYDKADNLVALGSTSQAFDAANELCWSTAKTVKKPRCTKTPKGPTRYTYNRQGDLTSTKGKAGKKQASGEAYNYDQADRLVTFVSGPTIASYVYNGDGLRQSKTVDGVTTQFTWDDSVVPELLTDGTDDYLYGPDGLPVEQINSSAGTFWYFHDQLGSTRVLTTSASTVAATYSFNAYGVQVGNTGTVTTPIQFGGQFEDSESGLIYLRTRYYDPKSGELLTVDPQVQSTGSAYGYAADDPLNKIDPTGESILTPWTWNPWVQGGLVVALNIVEVVPTLGLDSGAVAAQDAALLSAEAAARETTTEGGVYTLQDGSNVVSYVGRTSNLANRALQHGDTYPDYTFNVAYDTDSYAEQRGLEQMLLDANPQAMYENGGLNRIRGISLTNPNCEQYMNAAQSFLDQ